MEVTRPESGREISHPATPEVSRVVHVVRSLETGGLESLVLEVCRQFIALRGLDVRILAMQAGDGLGRRGEYQAIPTTVLPRCGRVRMLWALRREFRRLRPDVVHVHNFHAHVHGVPAARAARIPVIVSTKHGAEMPRLLGSRALAGRAYRMADAMVAVSRDVRDLLLATYGFEPERVRLILNGIDTERFRPIDVGREEQRARVLGVTGAPLVGTVCRLVQLKGVDTLLTAFDRVRRRLPGAVLVVVGDGPERANLEARAAGLGLGGSVRFLGTRADTAAIYPLLDVFVLASFTEGISLTVLEAAACRVPVVATDVGGNSEVLEHRRSALIVPPRDAPALAHAVLELCERPDMAAGIAAAARERVVEHFSLNRMTRDYVDLYNEIYRRKRVDA